MENNTHYSQLPQFKDLYKPLTAIRDGIVDAFQDMWPESYIVVSQVPYLFTSGFVPFTNGGFNITTWRDLGMDVRAGFAPPELQKLRMRAFQHLQDSGESLSEVEEAYYYSVSVEITCRSPSIYLNSDIKDSVVNIKVIIDASEYGCSKDSSVIFDVDYSPQFIRYNLHEALNPVSDCLDDWYGDNLV